MLTAKKTLKFLITPNYALPYDQRMVGGLADGFRRIGHQAVALPAPVSSMEVARQCREKSVDVVIQVNRTRDPKVDLPPRVRHISWYQDVFPESMNGFKECFRESDILYALGDPAVLGLNLKLSCLVGSLVTGVDQTVLDYRKPQPLHPVDFSLCGFIPPPLPRPTSLLRYLQPGKARYGVPEAIVKTVQDAYQPLRGALDIHELAGAIYASLERHRSRRSDVIRRLRNRLSQMPGLKKPLAAYDSILSARAQKMVSYFTREYPRLLDRVALVESVLEVSDSLALYGPGWDKHRQFRPYARGVIDTQEGLLAVYCRSRINLSNNTHGLGLHSRTLECMAVGGFILMHASPHDNKPGGMLTAFEPETHYGLYTPESLKETARRWLLEEKKRIEAGRRAAEVIREQHGWQHRAAQICRDLQE